LDCILIADSMDLAAADSFHTDVCDAFSVIRQNNGHYAVQGRSRSLILVPIEASYATSCYWIILTYIIARTITKLLWITGHIFHFRQEYLLTH